MTAHDAATNQATHAGIDAAISAAEVHVHIGRLVIDAPSAGAAGVQSFEAALQAALAQRLGAAAPTGPDGLPDRWRRGFDVPHAVADAVAARLRPHIAPGARG
jgi:hypothetical protein